MLTEAKFKELMQQDLQRFIAEKKDDVMHKGEAKELTDAMYWTRHPLTPNIVNEYAKKYKMKPEDFEEYAHKFKSFYEGK